jgi:hypothetical protein
VGVSVFIVNNGSYVIPFSEIRLADVESMRGKARSNHGWILLSQSEDTPKTARRIAAKENLSDASLLEITYALPTPIEIPLLDHRFDHETKEVAITILTEPGTTYVLERTLDLVPPSWMPIVEATIDMESTFELRASTAGLNAAFFRITSIPPEP